MKSFFSHTTYATDEPDLPAKDEDEKRLLNELKLARTELEIAYSGFDNATDPDLIDCYIYKVNAVLKRYKFLIGKAVEMNIVKAADFTPLPKEDFQD
ncbi:MAG: YaaL family protein [Lachnospiraceae bacterium]|nr:YaaL family protein [Lachnospiraceae bacterium]